MLSTRLQRFKLKKHQPYLANYRCFSCGDSQSNKLKARGYLYEDKGRIKAKCHNCEYYAGFQKFINDVDPMLAGEYRIECLKENGRSPDKEVFKPDVAKFSKPRFQKFEPLKALKRVSQLPLTHPVSVYVRETRMIPSKYHYKLFFAPKFNAWVNTVIPGKFEDQQVENDEPRLVIPFVDENGYCFGFQGRSLRKNSSLRYITIMIDETKPKVFGLDAIDFQKDFFIFEGPIDSMFVDNSLALAGSDGSILSILSKDKGTLVFDNEPRNKSIVAKIESAIDNNYRVVIFPKSIITKDINDLIIVGNSIPEVRKLLHTNSHRGLAAKLAFNEWKRV